MKSSAHKDLVQLPDGGVRCERKSRGSIIVAFTGWKPVGQGAPAQTGSLWGYTLPFKRTFTPK